MRVDTLPRPGAARGPFPTIALVALFHVLLIWILTSGLASQLQSDLRPAPPVSARLIPEDKPTSPERRSVTSKPRIMLPNQMTPDFPTVTVEDPTLPRQTTQPTRDDPTEPRASAGSNAGASSRAPAAGHAAPASAWGGCSNAREVGSQIEYPAKARRLGLNAGTAEVTFAVTAEGRISVLGLQASNRAFEAAALEAAGRLHCLPGEYVLPLSFALSD